MKYCIFIAFAAIYAFSYTFAGFVVPTPPTDGYVVDEVGVLTIEQRYTLNQTITALETTTKHQIGIVFVQSLQDRSIEEASLAVARSW